MSFTTRILPRAEYGKLAGTELETVAPLLPETARVLVVEDGAELMACWALMPVYHVEGLWIAPAHRRGRVGLTLWTAMKTLARGLGIRTVATASVTADVEALLAHVGATELPGKHFVMGMD